MRHHCLLIFILWCIVQKYWPIDHCLIFHGLRKHSRDLGQIQIVNRDGRVTCNDTWPIFLHNTPKYEYFCTKLKIEYFCTKKKLGRIAQHGLSKNIHLWAQGTLEPRKANELGSPGRTSSSGAQGEHKLMFTAWQPRKDWATKYTKKLSLSNSFRGDLT